MRTSENAVKAKFARCLMYKYPHFARISYIRGNLGAEAHGVGPTHTLPCPVWQEARRTPTVLVPAPAAARTGATRPAHAEYSHGPPACELLRCDSQGG